MRLKRKIEFSLCYLLLLSISLLVRLDVEMNVDQRLDADVKYL